MSVQNRLSVSFGDEEYAVLERLSSHTHKSKAELIRLIVEEFLRDNPDRFRRETSLRVSRKDNILLPKKT
ncbi:putative DNA-binding protein [Rhizobium petrolearium]|nr:putative DNA-binding protein [Neorhizobium petrolearium]